MVFDASEDAAWIAEQLTAADFDIDYRVVAEAALAYRKEYRKPPGTEHADDVLDALLNKKSQRADRYESLLRGMIIQAPGLNVAYLRTRVGEHIRRQMLKAAILKAADQYQNGGDDSVANAIETLRKAIADSDAAQKGNCETGVGPAIAAMSEMQMQPIFWLWPGMIPCGKLTLIAGDPKLGKSSLALSLIATLTTGGEWPDGTLCRKPADALIATTEDDPADTVLPRLVAMGADTKRCWCLKGVRRKAGAEIEDFDIERDLSAIERYLEQHPDIALVLIEPVVAHLNPKYGNEAEIRRKLGMLTRLAQTRNIAVIGIMHFRKAGDAATPIHMIAGSLAYGAVARVIYGVVEDKDDSERRLFLPMGNNLGASKRGLAFRIEGVRLDRGIEPGRVVWEGPVEISAREALAREPTKTKAATAEEWLRARLVGNGPVPATQLREEIEAMGLWSWKTVERAADKIGITKQGKGFPAVSMWVYQPH